MLLVRSILELAGWLQAEVTMRPSTEQLDTFIAVVQASSFARAAEQLGVSRSIVSRRIAHLEETLGVRLFSRSTHIVVPTELGVQFYDRAKRVMFELDNALDFLTDATSEVAGTVRISAPTTFGIKFLTPTVQLLMIDFPRLNVEVVLRDDSEYNPLSGGVDFTICTGILGDSSLVAKYFKPVPQFLVCSPDFAAKRGVPATALELVRYECLLYNGMPGASPWQYYNDGAWEGIKVNGRLVSNNAQVICDAAEAKMGLALVPAYVVSDSIAQGRLIRVMSDVQFRDLGLYAVFPPHPRFPTKVRAVVDFLAAKWKKPLPTGVDKSKDVSLLPPVAANGHNGGSVVPGRLSKTSFAVRSAS
jgi:DNA-binding transcriptional LysR family regulator